MGQVIQEIITAIRKWNVATPDADQPAAIYMHPHAIVNLKREIEALALVQFSISQDDAMTICGVPVRMSTDARPWFLASR